jgi:hypothetical protein
LSVHIWKQRNTELHRTDSAISLERHQKETATEAENIYENTIGKVSPTDSIVLHHSPIDKIIKWSKDRLDPYLASADIIIIQRSVWAALLHALWARSHMVLTDKVF